MKCPYDDGGSQEYVRCRHLSEFATITISVERAICDECVKTGQNQSQVSKADAPMLFNIMKGCLEARLHGLDLPRHQRVDPIDVNRAFARHLEISEDGESRDLLRAIIHRTAKVNEDEGGLSPEELARRLVSLADQFDMTNVVEDFINDQAAARTRLSRGHAG